MALSLGSRLLDVIQRFALWSPDFPRSIPGTRSSGMLEVLFILYVKDIIMKTFFQQKRKEFLDYLAINVSEFIRNPSIWWHLRDKVLPELIKEKGRRLKMWSAGSATGEEAYSLAILAEELKLLCPPYIDAWDIDEEATNIALKGIYHQRQLTNVPPNWIDKYFVKIDEEHFKVKDTIRRRVQFKIMILLNITFPQNEYDLILCRNVVIYFSAETKKTLYQKFVKTLCPGGIMMVGATEHIYDYRSLDLEPLGQFLYRRK